MKKTNTKKTLIIENKKLILEDYDDADGFKDWKNMVKTGLDAFKSFAGMLKDVMFVYPGSIAYEYYVNDKTLKAAIMSATKDLDKKYIAYSRKMDSIFEASGVAKDVNAAMSLAFLPAIGLDWYVGNEELERIKNEVIKGDGKRLWNNFVQENRRNNKKYFSKESLEFDIEPEKIYRNSAARESLNVTLYNLFITLSQFTATPSKLTSGYSSFKDLTKAFGNASNVAAQIRDTRKPSTASEAEMIRQCLKQLEIEATKHRFDADHIECIKILYQTKTYKSVDKMITALLTLGRDVNYKLSLVKNVIESIAGDPTKMSAFQGLAKAIDPKTITESTLNTNASLLIFNNDFTLLKEEDEGEEKSSDDKQTSEDQTSEEGKKSFLAFFTKVSETVSSVVKQDIVLWNLTKDLLYYNASIATLANLEMFYANLVDNLNNVDSLDNIEKTIESLQKGIANSTSEKMQLYNANNDAKPTNERVPEGMSIVINDLPVLPKDTGIDISKLQGEIKKIYNVDKFIEECKTNTNDKDVLYAIPRQFLGAFDDGGLQKFLEDKEAINYYLNLFLRKNLVDTLLGSGAKSEELDANIAAIDDNLNGMITALESIKNDESINLSELIKAASKNKNEDIVKRVDALKKAYQGLDKTIETVSEMEEKAKSYESLGQELVKGIEELFTRFKVGPEEESDKESGEESEKGKSEEDKSSEESETEQPGSEDTKPDA